MTTAARYVPGRLSELRARRERIRIDLGPLRSALAALALWAATLAGLAVMAAGFWIAWEPLGLLFAGAAIVACAGLFAYLRGASL